MSPNTSVDIEYAEEAFENCNDCCCKHIETKGDTQLFSLGTLEDDYEVGTVLGKGGFGIVYAGIRKKEKTKVAIKHIAKSKLTGMEMVNILAFVFPCNHSTFFPAK